MTTTGPKNVIEMNSEEVAQALLDNPAVIAEIEEEVTEPIVEEQITTPEPEDEQTDPDDFVFDEKLYTDKDPQDLIQEIKRIQKKVVEKEKMIYRQSQEVGEARRKEKFHLDRIEEAERKLHELATKEESLDPVDYDNHIIDRHKAETALQQSKKEIAIMQNEYWLKSQYPEFDTLMKDVVPNMIKEDLESRGQGLSYESVMSDLRGDSWKYQNPETINQILYQARERQRTKSLADQVKDLQTKIAELSKAPDTIGKKMEQVSNQTSRIPTGGSTGKPSLDSLSLAEIKEKLGVT